MIALRNIRVSARFRPGGSPCRPAPVAGFTLLELLVSFVVLAMIAGIVYASFAGVTNATETARLSAAEMHLGQFLSRHLTDAFTSVYTDPGCWVEDYYFLGQNNEGPNGPMDAVEFCSASLSAGGTGLPGQLKRTVMELVDPSATDLSLDGFDQASGDMLRQAPGADASPTLRVTETPLVMTNAWGVENPEDLFADMSEEFVEQMQMETMGWSVPASSLDVLYFDGEEWVEEWDSIAMARMPWAVHIKINFARSPEEIQNERSAGRDFEEEPDFETIVPVPIGVGVISEFIPEEQVPVQEQGRNPDNRDNDGGNDGRQRNQNKSHRSTGRALR